MLQMYYTYYIYITHIHIDMARYIELLPTDFYIQQRSFVYITFIMCWSGHLTSARFDHFECHRYIWCIFSLACLVFVIQQIYHVIKMFNHDQWWKKYLLKQSDVMNLLYIGQTLLKISRKVQWMVKYVKT